MPTTPATRKAEERARKRALGLVKIELWADPRDHQALKEYALKLAKKRLKRASQPAAGGAESLRP